MTKINKILIAAIIGSFVVIPSLKSYAIKKSVKSNKPVKTQQETVASQSAVVFVFPVDIEKQPFKPVERVITGIFINKQQDEKEKNKEEEKQPANNSVLKKDNNANSPDSSKKPREPRLFK